jgi:hypothetical protein
VITKVVAKVITRSMGLIERRSLRGTQEFHLWFCASKIHILFAATRSADTRRKHIFLISVSPQTDFSERLGVSFSRYSYLLFCYRILFEFILGTRIVVFVPHISPAVADSDGKGLLWRLYSRGLLRFYDDGITALSDQTYLHQGGMIPPGQPVDVWDYPFLSRRPNGSAVSLSAAHRILLKAFQDSKDIFDDCLSFLPGAAFPNPVTAESEMLVIVLSSSWLDHEVMEAHLSHGSFEPSQAVYIPHYNPNKNSQWLIDHCKLVNCEFPELFLARCIEVRPCRLYFGVTSTALYLCELARRGDVLPFEAVFIGRLSLAEKHGRGQEYKDFVQALSNYQVTIDKHAFA